MDWDDEEGFGPARHKVRECDNKYRGSIVVDTKNASGLLVLKSMFMANGWEWTYGK